MSPEKESKELEKIEAEYIDKKRRVALMDAGFMYDDVDDYVVFLRSEESKELEEEAKILLADSSGEVVPIHEEKPLRRRKKWNPFGLQDNPFVDDE